MQDTETPPPAPRTARLLITGLGLLMGVMTTLVLTVALRSGNPVFRAVMLMATGLVFLWCVLGGVVMYLVRDRVRRLVMSLPGWWAVKFVVFCTLLALAEEVVTTTMTNCAPLFGVPAGKAYITASSNYFDVVCFHSVIVFVPMFIGWAWMLSRWDFHPSAVFLLFGLTGTFAETGFWPSKLGEAGMWVFVYGLMVYLPAYCLPLDRTMRSPRWWQYPVAVFVPLLFTVVLMLPYFLTRRWFHPQDVHFPPIQLDR